MPRWRSRMNRALVVTGALLLLGSASVHASNDTAGGIAYYATWERAKALAQETNRPILLVAAAPQCHAVPGLW
jgi:hypothetical protein